MSFYNNYSSAASNHQYLQLIKTLIAVLEKRIIRFYQGRKCNDNKFFNILHRLIQKITRLEINNHQENIFQDSVKGLLDNFSPFNQEQFKRMSTMSAGSLGFDDKISHVSINSSFEDLPRSKIKVRT